MSQTLYDRLEPLATRGVVALLVVFLLVLVLVVFPALIRPFEALASQVGQISTQFSYSPQQVFQMVAAYGPEGRSTYMIATLTADVLFPLDYALLMALLIVLTYRQAFPSSRLVFSLVWVPFLTALMDLLENVFIVTLLATFPQQIIFVAQAASLFTSLKWVIGGISILLTLIGLIGWVVVKLRR